MGLFGKFKKKDEFIKIGIEKTIMPARMELIKKKPVIILDGGHNEGCAAVLSNFIKKHLSGKRIVMVSSLMADKDYLSYLSSVCPSMQKESRYGQMLMVYVPQIPAGYRTPSILKRSHSRRRQKWLISAQRCFTR